MSLVELWAICDYYVLHPTLRRPTPIGFNRISVFVSGRGGMNSTRSGEAAPQSDSCDKFRNGITTICVQRSIQSMNRIFVLNRIFVPVRDLFTVPLDGSMVYLYR
jgi:hypothetical protein